MLQAPRNPARISRKRKNFAAPRKKLRYSYPAMKQILPDWLLVAVVLASMTLTSCDKSEDRHVWDNYSTGDAGNDGYVDNDEYYIPPTGGYNNDAILDPD
jgi:hypothetical protein